MKLQRVLDKLNAFEKNSFLKIIDSLIEDSPTNIDKINQILSESAEKDKLKNMDNINISRVFTLLEEEYMKYLEKEISKANSQLDIITDIVIRDGNCIMKYDWLANLYDKVIIDFQKHSKEFHDLYFKDTTKREDSRCRDFQIYKACLDTAYYNDISNNQDKKITADEHSILTTLSQQLSLSQEEVKLIKYLTIPLIKQPIDEVIEELKKSGIAFYSKKSSTVYVADEIVRVLRKVRGKEVADKFYRRVLKTLRPAQIKKVCRYYNLPSKGLSNDELIRQVINNGISFTSTLSEGIFSADVSLVERKKYFNELCSKELQIKTNLKGATICQKIESLIKYYEDIESEEKVSITIDGYEKLLKDLSQIISDLNNLLKEEFELQDTDVLDSEYLVDYNIKPRDVLEIIAIEKLKNFCQAKMIKTRGNIIHNILEAYTNQESIYLENYEHIGFRDLNELKTNGISLSENDLGVLFESLTKNILTALNLNVDEALRKDLNTAKDKIDVIINLGGNEIIIVECKTVKEKGYNQFSTVSRQMKSYVKLACKKGYNVSKVLLVAPSFSDDFITSCRLDYELNLSLIKASSLLKIMECFKQSRLTEFPLNLFKKDVLINEDNILRAIGK